MASNEGDIVALDDVFDTIEKGFWDDEDDLLKQIEKFESEVNEVEESDKTKLHNCPECPKRCKSKGGLSLHMKAKHPETLTATTSSNEDENVAFMNTSKLNEESFAALIKQAAAKLAKDECFPASTIRDTFSQFELNHNNKQLTTTLYKHFEETLTISNIDKYYSKFYAIISNDPVPVLNEKIGTECTTLLCHELCNHVLGHILKNDQLNESHVIKELTAKEYAVLEYMTGYVFHKIFNKLRFSKYRKKENHVQLIEILKASKVESGSQSQRLVDIKNRGGLWAMNKDCVNVFLEVEHQFRKITSGFVKAIDSKKFVEKLMLNPIVLTHFDTICRNADLGLHLDSEVKSVLLETLLSLFTRIRSHSYAKSVKEKFMVAAKKKKSRSLRNELKKAQSPPSEKE